MNGAPYSHFQAVVFDIGRVLVDVDVPRAVRGVAELAGVGHYEAEVAMFGPHHRKLSCGTIDAASFHAEVCRGLGKQLPFERFRERWCDMFSPVPDMEPLVAAVARRHPVYLCSNTDPLHYAHLRAENPILSYAKGAVLSYEVGHEKPDPDIFRALLDRFALRPEGTIFIDDRTENVTGAEACGIHGIVFEGAADLQAALVELGVLPA